jgi:hypothetical protein
LSACVEQLSHIQSIGNSTEEVIFLQAANTWSNLNWQM